MRRAAWLTFLAAVVSGVAAGLVRDARRLDPGTSRTLLLALLIFLVFEWLAHFLSSRLSRVRHSGPDRAAWAALSSAGIWIALLAAVPFGLRALAIRPVGCLGIFVVTVAASAALLGRLWFLREIYEIELERAAALWTASRGAAIGIVCVAVTVYAVSSYTGAPVPLMRVGP